MRKEIILNELQLVNLSQISDDLEISFYMDRNIKDKIEIIYEGDFEKDYNIFLKEKEKEIKIESVEKIKINLFSFNYVNKKNNLYVTLPQNISITVNSNGGDIIVNRDDKIKVDLKSIKINTKAGDIKLKSLNSSTSKIKNAAGDIIINELSSYELEVFNLAGDTKMENVFFSKCDVSNLAGDLSIDIMNEDFKSILINCNAGSIKVGVPLSKLNYSTRALAGSVSFEGINYDSNSPRLEAKCLAGDIIVSYKRNENSKNIRDINLDELKVGNNNINKNNDENLGKEKDKEKDKEKVLSLLLQNKIKENEAKEILESLGFSKEEIDNFFEEYLFL
ncbi:MAG: DUF4097 domain-containing protein, partial [Spirochaetes bacterium]|nr:DUF4097 domain-containing protein [Spirochaetota bacterium]